ncbi:hypothetical protein [Fodinicola feengrottensis]|uniref:Uncharacterized protein n=1 Tax=Fodinicola feengrottensis TaxID=435914 RepID=A0ABN2GJC3_9ACTN|nr:hypothetical protein [Fodinicola feengrottensis]
MIADTQVDADRIAVAVQAGRHVARLHSGRFGELATYLPGRRIPGVRIGLAEVSIGVVGIYPATVAEIARDVRTAVAITDRPVHVHILDMVMTTLVVPIVLVAPVGPSVSAVVATPSIHS